MKNIILTFLFTGCTILLSFAQSSILDFYEADVQSIIKRNPNAKVTLLEKDIANGFMTYKVEEHDRSNLKHMAYFIANNGSKFVAIVSADCQQECIVTDFRFYKLENNQLVTGVEPEPYPIDLSAKVTDAISEKLEDNTLWIKLPQYGTTIQFGYYKIPSKRMDNFIVICELLFDVEAGIFSFSNN